MIFCPNCNSQFVGETIQLSNQVTVIKCTKCGKQLGVNYPRPGMLTGDSKELREYKFWQVQKENNVAVLNALTQVNARRAEARLKELEQARRDQNTIKVHTLLTDYEREDMREVVHKYEGLRKAVEAWLDEQRDV